MESPPIPRSGSRGGIALIAVTPAGLDKARLLRQRLRTGALYRPRRYGPSQQVWEQPYVGALSAQIAALLQSYDQLVFFLATGAVVRLIAKHLGHKTTDPGVLAVDEAGRFVVPVLSGHQGGANAFARTVAGYLGATPIITTASDLIGGLSLDLLEAAFGWVAEPPERLKAAAMSLLHPASVAIVQEVGGSGSWLDAQTLPEHVTFTHQVTQLPSTPPSPPPSRPLRGHPSQEGKGQGGGGAVFPSSEGCPKGRVFDFVLWITDRLVSDLHGLEAQRILWYRPPSLVLGVGCERGISLAGLDDGLETFLRQCGYAKSSIAAVASLDRKADEEAIVALAQRYGWTTHFYTAAELAQVPGIARPSPVVAQSVGTPGVAEPAALRTAQVSRLLVEKHVMASPAAPQRMTFALARDAAFQDRTAYRGKVTFIGAGPGDPALLTLKAQRILARADVVIYAGSLIPAAVLQHAPATARLYNSAPLTLEEVMAILLDAVQAGKQVVRLQCGDLSLYSAIQEQMTRLDAADLPYEVIPGISAFQAAAAALQSELTIPEVVQTIILTRGEGQTPMPSGESLASLATHGASLCIFLSARLSRNVQAQLLTAYAPDTPVAILYRVSWPDEQIIVTELQHLHRAIRDHKLLRTTLIVVGQAIGARKNRSRLYNRTHAHIFRRSEHAENRSLT